MREKSRAISESHKDSMALRKAHLELELTEWTVALREKHTMLNTQNDNLKDFSID
jgi:hypothetical protein